LACGVLHVVQVLSYVELNPWLGLQPDGQPLQLLSGDQHKLLLRDAAVAWTYYVQRKLAGQQPWPVTDFVPWMPLGHNADACPDTTAAAAAGLRAASLEEPGIAKQQQQQQQPQPGQRLQQEAAAEAEPLGPASQPWSGPAPPRTTTALAGTAAEAPKAAAVTSDGHSPVPKACARSAAAANGGACPGVQDHKQGPGSVADAAVGAVAARHTPATQQVQALAAEGSAPAAPAAAGARVACPPAPPTPANPPAPGGGGALQATASTPTAAQTPAAPLPAAVAAAAAGTERHAAQSAADTAEAAAARPLPAVAAQPTCLKSPRPEAAGKVAPSAAAGAKCQQQQQQQQQQGPENEPEEGEVIEAGEAAAANGQDNKHCCAGPDNAQAQQNSKSPVQEQQQQLEAAPVTTILRRGSCSNHNQQPLRRGTEVRRDRSRSRSRSRSKSRSRKPASQQQATPNRQPLRRPGSSGSAGNRAKTRSRSRSRSRSRRAVRDRQQLQPGRSPFSRPSIGLRKSNGRSRSHSRSHSPSRSRSRSSSGVSGLKGRALHRSRSRSPGRPTARGRSRNRSRSRSPCPSKPAPAHAATCSRSHSAHSPSREDRLPAVKLGRADGNKTSIAKAPKSSSPQTAGRAAEPRSISRAVDRRAAVQVVQPSPRAGLAAEDKATAAASAAAAAAENGSAVAAVAKGGCSAGSSKQKLQGQPPQGLHDDKVVPRSNSRKQQQQQQQGAGQAVKAAVAGVSGQQDSAAAVTCKVSSSQQHRQQQDAGQAKPQQTANKLVKAAANSKGATAAAAAAPVKDVIAADNHAAGSDRQQQEPMDAAVESIGRSSAAAVNASAAAAAAAATSSAAVGKQQSSIRRSMPAGDQGSGARAAAATPSAGPVVVTDVASGGQSGGGSAAAYKDPNSSGNILKPLAVGAGSGPGSGSDGYGSGKAAPAAAAAAQAGGQGGTAGIAASAGGKRARDSSKPSCEADKAPCGTGQRSRVKADTAAAAPAAAAAVGAACRAPDKAPSSSGGKPQPSQGVAPIAGQLSNSGEPGSNSVGAATAAAAKHQGSSGGAAAAGLPPEPKSGPAAAAAATAAAKEGGSEGGAAGAVDLRSRIERLRRLRNRVLRPDAAALTEASAAGAATVVQPATGSECPQQPQGAAGAQAGSAMEPNHTSPGPEPAAKAVGSSSRPCSTTPQLQQQQQQQQKPQGVHSTDTQIRPAQQAAAEPDSAAGEGSKRPRKAAQQQQHAGQQTAAGTKRRQQEDEQQQQQAAKLQRVDSTQQQQRVKQQQQQQRAEDATGTEARALLSPNLAARLGDVGSSILRQQQQQQQGMRTGGQLAAPAVGSTARSSPGASQAATDPAAAHIQEVQTWLQRLAVKLPLTTPPTAIQLATLKEQLPVPACIVQHYGGVKELAAATPGLRWVQCTGKPNKLALEPQAHEELKAAAAAAEAAGPHQAAVHTAADGGNGSKAGCRAVSQQQQHTLQLQQQQQHDEGRGGCVPASLASRLGSGSHADIGFGEDFIDAEVKHWLLQLALLLQPSDLSKGIALRELRECLPIPRCVTQHYHGVPNFINKTPGLVWVGKSSVTLEQSYHKELMLLAAATEAGYDSMLQEHQLLQNHHHQQEQEQQYWEAEEAEEEAGVAGELDQEGYIQSQVDAWLQQLALLLQPTYPAADSISLGRLRHELPIPECVVSHYGSPTAFVKATEGLVLVGKNMVSLLPQHHKDLRQAARASATHSSTLQQRQQQWEEDADDPHQRYSYEQPAAGEAGEQWEEDVQAQADAWLTKLALLLPQKTPPRTIALEDLRHQLPIPPCVIKHYGTVTKFVSATHGLQWDPASPVHIGLKPAVHRQLRAAAAAAAGASAAAAERQQYRQAQPAYSLSQQGMHPEIRAWLQQLALLLPLVEPLFSMPAAEVTRLLPVPRIGLEQSGSLYGFLKRCPGLVLDKKTNCIGLAPKLHWLLRQEAQAAAAVPPQLHQAPLPAHHPAGCTMQERQQYYRQLQQQQRQQHSRQHHQKHQQFWQEDAADGPWSANGADIAPQQRRAAMHDSTADGGQLPRHIEAEGLAWLEALARRLPLKLPEPSISLEVLRHELPIPGCVIEHYGTVTQFLRSIPGLHWDWPNNMIALDHDFHDWLLMESQTVRR